MRNYKNEQVQISSTVMDLDQTNVKVQVMDEGLALHCLEHNTNLKQHNTNNNR